MKPVHHQSDIPRTTSEFLVHQGGFRLAADVHAWLDADRHAPRTADAAHDVDFWHRLEADIARRRQVRTPVHVQRAVMAALPSPRASGPWHRRPVTLSASLMTLGAAALFALGLALGIAIR